MVRTALLVNGFSADDVIELCPSPIQLKIPISSFRNTAAQTFQTTSPKSVWAEVIEGCVEYSRIIFDLFPLEKIILVSQRDSPLLHNSFAPTKQNVTSIVSQFQDFRPTSTADLSQGISCCLENLAHRLAAEPHFDGRVRLICISPDLQSEGTQDWKQGQTHLQSLPIHINKLIASLNERNIHGSTLISHCEFIMLRFNAQTPVSTVEEPLELLSQTSTDLPFLSYKSAPIKPSLLCPLMLELARVQYPISRLAVSSMPVRSQFDNPSRVQIQLLFANPHAHAKLKTLSRNVDTQSQDIKSSSSVLQLTWKTVDKLSSVYSLPTKCIHRITPGNVTSNESVAFAKYVISDRRVIALGGRTNSKTQPPSHLLLAHEGEIFLHCISETAYLSLAEIKGQTVPKIINDSQFRKSHFADIIYSNLINFMPSAPASRNFNTSETVAPSDMEFKTRFFPVHQSQTILFNTSQTEDLKTLMDPIKSLYLQRQISVSEKEICLGLSHYALQFLQISDVGLSLLQYIKRYHRSCTIRESRLFPQEFSETQRTESYKKLTGELLDFFRVYASTDNHRNIFNETQQLFTTMEKSSFKQTPQNPGYSEDQQNNLRKDFFQQAEAATLESEKRTWLKADESQKPVQEALARGSNLLLSGSSSGNSGVLKKSKVELEMEKIDSDSLFFKYWSKNVQTTIPFDGWK